ncbi:betaine-aldehyde dehydrogenase [Amycolatopsis bartoniae]|uniref:aldehyde dehydrogenase (NAD(+)) n=1 Tax=Amycolatopsis bartoniae TaxID=941986 RepID=A0A8H9IN34_9PSEU|nr:aldehyde dehydrogenase [Amycolatopsis bartoniae]MBB2939746.1 betaine-aldehyde dehydrogenase [Amycolatopsis bartoniae]TVT08357.1 aldehyde dehydrogenase [Amycolatopsis bartoniae]GHF36100.1 aldehyde dehydrogenase [Amycolatopsis bartoniae]
MPGYDYDRILIGGRWTEPASPEKVEVVSPTTEEVVARIPRVTAADVDRAVDAARESWRRRAWRDAPPDERISAVRRLADLLAEHADDLAQRVTSEMGSPITMSKGSQAGAIGLVRSFADAYEKLTLEERRPGPRGPAWILREPVGVVAAISPWNGPLFLSLVKVVPALLTGCSVVAKPAVETPLTGFVLGELLQRAGIPDGVVSILPADRDAGQHLVAHPGIDKVTFTGSTAAGRRIAATCGEHLKRVSLELGGKSAALALDDVEVDVLVPALLAGSFYNSGQACNALTRLVVHRSRHDEVVDALIDGVKGLVVGDPADPKTQIGPMASATQRARVESYIEAGRAEGATVACGGGRPADLPRGWYVEPTVFTGVDNSMRVAQEEIFGPVLSVIPFDGGDEAAVAIANDSDYGLHGAVFTADPERALAVARRVESGTFTINGYLTNTAAPFGGLKASGLGREFGPEGLGEFLEYRTINDPRASS